MIRLNVTYIPEEGSSQPVTFNEQYITAALLKAQTDNMFNAFGMIAAGSLRVLVANVDALRAELGIQSTSTDSHVEMG